MLENLQNKKIILASKSPRRQELLKGLGLNFEVRTKDIEEIYSADLRAEDVPVFLSEKKANEFLHELKSGEIIITSDTIVIHQGKILEKPKSKEEAHEMLRRLADSEHIVVTGVCIQSLEKKIVFSDLTLVEFSALTDEEIDFYIENYKPFDKAGSYGAQDWIGFVAIKKLTGSYFNVMGLPVHRVYAELKNF
ncbi:MAG: septum formation protein Maf [Crocinitomicaceae bacterium]|jgi:septum formation protein|nr:septum formation protein Maf [Crocinitomicaceae bacterium]MBK9592951.1 septum formation protein Maf [Crocinitomicaceae bacterium]